VKRGEDNTNSPELSLSKFLLLVYYYSHFLAATLDFTSFFTSAFFVFRQQVEKIHTHLQYQYFKFKFMHKLNLSINFMQLNCVLDLNLDFLTYSALDDIYLQHS